jgi:CubicO group peptidase (beta-lactamase class C family)
MRIPAVCFVLASLAGVPAAAVAASPAYSAEDEAVYRLRFERWQEGARRGLALETYEPLEAIPGASGWAPLGVAPARERSISEAALGEARDYAARNNSIALLVWHRGRLQQAEYFGGAVPASTFPSRSLAKPMTAVVVGRAIALGAIRSLDQPAADFLQEWRQDPRRSRVLVRHLLDMRLGLLPQGLALTAEDILNRAYLHPRHEQVILHDYPIVDEPGTRYEYNNATSELVALLIERATGRRYAEFVSTEVLRPIGAPGGEVWINRPGGLAHSGCCMMLPPEAWLRLGVLVLQDGVWDGRRLLPEGYVRDMTTGTPQNPYYGLGTYVAGPYVVRRGFANPARDRESLRVLHSEPYLAGDLALFDGNSNQVVYMVPSQQLVVLRVGGPPPRAEGKEWDNAFLPNAIIRGIVRLAGERVPVPQPRN